MQGQWNSDLNVLGRAQADQNGRFLATLDIEYLVASPLDRTRQTASIINEHLGLEVSFDDRIMEWNCGDWSGEMWDEVAEKWPEEFAAWQEDPFNYRGPNCENYPDMIERARPFLEEMVNLPRKRIAIVSHGMIGRVMVGTLLEMSAEEMFTFGQTNDAIIQLTAQPGTWATQHFIGGEGPLPDLPPSTYRR